MQYTDHQYHKRGYTEEFDIGIGKVWDCILVGILGPLTFLFSLFTVFIFHRLIK